MSFSLKVDFSIMWNIYFMLPSIYIFCYVTMKNNDRSGMIIFTFLMKELTLGPSYYML